MYSESLLDENRPSRPLIVVPIESVLASASAVAFKAESRSGNCLFMMETGRIVIEGPASELKQSVREAYLRDAAVMA
jgi:ABC-type branched-subunit amino acid transport system ATPase component